MKNKLYFMNDYLRMEQISDTDFEYDFLGETYYTCCSKKSLEFLFEETRQKRIRTYNLVPKGCRIIPKRFIHLYKGLLVGGVLEDSIKIVYGIANFNGINGYGCSLYFLPNKKVLQKITDYEAVSKND